MTSTRLTCSLATIALVLAACGSKGLTAAERAQAERVTNVDKTQRAVAGQPAPLPSADAGSTVAVVAALAS